jgi:hypothetical protein
MGEETFMGGGAGRMGRGFPGKGGGMHTSLQPPELKFVRVREGTWWLRWRLGRAGPFGFAGAAKAPQWFRDKEEFMSFLSRIQISAGVGEGALA